MFCSHTLVRRINLKIFLFLISELPPKNLMCCLDGDTNGVEGTNGPIGQACKSLDKDQLKMKLRFKMKIATNIPKLDPKYLKGQRDLKLLHDWCWAIHNGKFDSEEEQAYYEKALCPKMHNARWFTTYIRILSAFARLIYPSRVWIIMVTYILQAYAKNVFAIHFKPLMIHGSVHFNNYLRDSEQCLRPFIGKFKFSAGIDKRTEKIIWSRDLFQDKIFPCFTRYQNACYLHPESILLSGVASDDKKMAQKAFEIYIKSLKFHENRETIRRFIPPKPEWVNVQAENCIEMLKWDMIPDDYITPPPLLMGLYKEVEDIRKIVYGSGKLDIPPFLSHSQFNEAAIKQTTLSAKFNRTHDQQQANILTAKKSREDFPLGFRLSHFTEKE